MKNSLKKNIQKKLLETQLVFLWHVVRHQNYELHKLPEYTECVTEKMYNTFEWRRGFCKYLIDELKSYYGSTYTDMKTDLYNYGFIFKPDFPPEYVPDEIQIFSEKISKKLLDWELTTSSDFVPLVGESLCFPDYLLTHKSGNLYP